jgi:hypothetical protein
MKRLHPGEKRSVREKSHTWLPRGHRLNVVAACNHNSESRTSSESSREETFF